MLQMLLRQYLEMGKIKPGSGGARVLVVPPYVIEYEIHPDEVMILVIPHGRQEERHEEDEDRFED
jgi:plasmid stabilization system protein ParE